jgi:hypothetical protein
MRFVPAAILNIFLHLKPGGILENRPPPTTCTLLNDYIYNFIALSPLEGM